MRSLASLVIGLGPSNRDFIVVYIYWEFALCLLVESFSIAWSRLLGSSLYALHFRIVFYMNKISISNRTLHTYLILILFNAHKKSPQDGM